MDEKQLAAELQASKDDPREWGDVDAGPGASAPKKRLSAMISIRLAEEELEQVQLRAQERGQSVSAYLRELALRDVSGGSQVEGFPPFAVWISTGDTYSTHVDAPGVVSDGRRLTTLSG